jgi:hypothetical protein
MGFFLIFVVVNEGQAEVFGVIFVMGFCHYSENDKTFKKILSFINLILYDSR